MGCGTSTNSQALHIEPREVLTGKEKEIRLCVEVLRAANLPKTDRLRGEIDAYVVVKFGGEESRTTVIDDNSNPHWNEFLYLDGNVDLETPHGSILFELWDKNAVNDKEVATAEIQISSIVNEWKKPSIEDLTIPWILKGGITGVSSEPACLFSRFYFTNSLNLFTELLMEKGISHSVLHDTVFVPWPTADSVCLAIEFRKQCPLQLKIFSTKFTPDRVVDFQSSGSEFNFQMSENTTGSKEGEHICYQNCTTYISNPRVLSGLECRICSREQENKYTAGEIASQHGWNGSLSYEEAKDVLKDTEYDDAEKMIFMVLPFGGIFVIDFNRGTADIEVWSNSDVSHGHIHTRYEISTNGNGNKICSSFFPSRALKSRTITYRSKLDQVEAGTPFSSIAIKKYKYVSLMTTSILNLLPLTLQ